MCASQQGGQEVKYFQSWAGYSIPVKPKGEISKEEAIAAGNYYVGTYEGKKLVSFEKILNGERAWIDTYEYWENSKKLKTRTMDKANGETIVQNYDRKGKLVE